jgi:hypothetical protein
MLSQIRYEQQYQQLQNAPKPGVSDVMVYGGRDPVTGSRIVKDALGAPSLAQYLSNAQPAGVMAVSQSGSIGLPGYINQKVR